MTDWLMQKKSEYNHKNTEKEKKKSNNKSEDKEEKKERTKEKAHRKFSEDNNIYINRQIIQMTMKPFWDMNKWVLSYNGRQNTSK